MFIVNIEGAIHKAEKWLVIERSLKEEHAGGTLSLVGGKLDEEGYSLNIMERTIIREIYEEVGIRVKPTPYFLYSSSFVLDDGRHVINVVFLCEYDQGTAFSKSPDEVEAVNWMTRDQIIDHPKVTSWLRESINRAEMQRAGTR